MSNYLFFSSRFVNVFRYFKKIENKRNLNIYFFIEYGSLKDV